MLWAADAVKIIDATRAVLGTPEIWQHIGIRPAGVAALRPDVEIIGLATYIKMAIDGTGTAKHFAAGKGDRPAVDTRAGGGLNPQVKRGWWTVLINPAGIRTKG